MVISNKQRTDQPPEKMCFLPSQATRFRSTKKSIKESWQLPSSTINDETHELFSFIINTMPTMLCSCAVRKLKMQLANINFVTGTLKNQFLYFILTLRERPWSLSWSGTINYFQLLATTTCFCPNTEPILSFRLVLPLVHTTGCRFPCPSWLVQLTRTPAEMIQYACKTWTILAYSCLKKQNKNTRLNINLTGTI